MDETNQAAQEPGPTKKRPRWRFTSRPIDYFALGFKLTIELHYWIALECYLIKWHVIWERE
jgi:hypothetical protein